MSIPRVNILGTGVSAVNMEMALAAIAGWIDNRSQHTICVTPAHSIMDGYHQPELRRIFNDSGMTTPDGMPTVWLARLAGYKHVSRVYGPDLMDNTCRISVERGWRHFFYGGAPGVAEDLAARLDAKYPGLQVVGIYAPPFRPLTSEEDRNVVERINQARPDIVWVGIGSPKQEYWMQAHLGQVEAPVLAGVGAAFDFLSGRKKQAPRWLQRSGLEWLFRFASEPGRLWRRYAQYPLFVWLVVLQRLGLRHFPM